MEVLSLVGIRGYVVFLISTIMTFLEEPRRIVVNWEDSWIEYIGYFPKEVFAENNWSCAVDVYALGMVIVHFLTNQKPF